MKSTSHPSAIAHSLPVGTYFIWILQYINAALRAAARSQPALPTCTAWLRADELRQRHVRAARRRVGGFACTR